MYREKRHIGWLLSSMLMLLVLILLPACTEDANTDSSGEPEGSPVQLLSVTRTSATLTPEDGNSIKMYVVTKEAPYSEGSFSYTDSWSNSNIRVKEHEQFYMYGYMPGTYGSSISAEASDLNGDYSKGADLTINDLPIFTSKDIYAIVGVQRISATSETKNVIEGNYGYLSGLNDENCVNLLMDHLYSKLILKMNVDANYSLLRDIKLKSVTLTCSYSQTVNVTVKLRTGYGLQGNATAYSANSSGTNQVYQLWTSTNESGTPIPSDENENDLLDLGTINCPPVVLDAAGTYMKIRCTYDVYDKVGNRLRECTVENKLKATNVDHGVEYTVTLTVAPTYIYVLSDDDLNNPTIIIN